MRVEKKGRWGGTSEAPSEVGREDKEEERGRKKGTRGRRTETGPGTGAEPGRRHKRWELERGTERATGTKEGNHNRHNHSSQELDIKQTPTPTKTKIIKTLKGNERKIREGRRDGRRDVDAGEILRQGKIRVIFVVPGSTSETPRPRRPSSTVTEGEGGDGSDRRSSAVLNEREERRVKTPGVRVLTPPSSIRPFRHLTGRKDGHSEGFCLRATVSSRS